MLVSNAEHGRARPSSAQSSRANTAGPIRVTGIIPGLDRQHAESTVRTEKERHEARLHQLDFELAAISAKATSHKSHTSHTSKDEFKRDRSEAREQRDAAELEQMLLTKLCRRLLEQNPATRADTTGLTEACWLPIAGSREPPRANATLQLRSCCNASSAITTRTVMAPSRIAAGGAWPWWRHSSTVRPPRKEPPGSGPLPTLTRGALTSQTSTRGCGAVVSVWQHLSFRALRTQV